MSIWGNLKIGLRFGIGIGIRLVLPLLVGGTAYYSLRGAREYGPLARSTAAAGVWYGDLLTVRVHHGKSLGAGHATSIQK
jgi:hypothetical protein